MVMSWQISTPNDSVNILSTSGATAMFAFKSLLLANGGTIRESSDGTTFGLSDNISHAGSGAGGMGNALAYYVISLGPMDLAIQRSAVDSTWWRCKISVVGFVNTSAGYVAGTATAMPIVTDQSHVVGTDAPSYGIWAMFLADGSTQFVSMGIDNVSPHHFWMITTTPGTTGSTTYFLFDELSDPAANDPWPYVIAWEYGAATIANLKAPNITSLYSYFLRGTPYSAWTRFPAVDQYEASSIVGGYAANPITLQDTSLLLQFGRSISNSYSMKKGYSVNMRLQGGPMRYFPDAADDLTGQRWTVVNSIMIKTPPGITLNG